MSDEEVEVELVKEVEVLLSLRDLTPAIRIAAVCVPRDEKELLSCRLGFAVGIEDDDLEVEIPSLIILSWVAERRRAGRKGAAESRSVRVTRDRCETSIEKKEEERRNLNYQTRFASGNLYHPYLSSLAICLLSSTSRVRA